MSFEDSTSFDNFGDVLDVQYEELSAGYSRQMGVISMEIQAIITRAERNIFYGEMYKRIEKTELDARWGDFF